MILALGRRVMLGLLAAGALASCEARREEPPAVAPERHAVFFQPDSAELDQLARDVIARIAENLRASPARGITLEAFANRTTAGTENRPLAQNRAQAIRLALEARGVDPRIVSAIVVGQTERIGPSALEGRRVDITIER